MGKILYFFIFGCLGITLEVFFTGIKHLIDNVRKSKNDYAVKGESYFWMFYIYGSIAFLFPPVYSILAGWNWLFRILTYGVLILLFEFIIGFLLKRLTGKCPWEYNSKLAIRGYIRLDYLPIWMLFGYLIEIIMAVPIHIP